MSKSPHAFGFFLPTFWYLKSLFFPHQQYSLIFEASSPQKYAVVVPARAAYSHSASVGRRKKSPVFALSHWQYLFAACCVMEIAGKPSLPIPKLISTYGCVGCVIA